MAPYSSALQGVFFVVHFYILMDLHLGPLDVRLYGGDNWSHFELAWVSNRHGGKARRETAVRAGFKSEHLISATGKDNPADTFECPQTGTLYFGRLVQIGNTIHAISARDVYSEALYKKAVKEGLLQAEQATLSSAAA